LVEAQGAMSASGAAARTAGPASAGALVQLLSAPLVIVVDVTALAIAWVLLLKMKVVEQVQSRSHLSFWRQVLEGLRFIFNDPNLKVLTWAVALWQVLFHAVLTLQILLATSELKLTPQAIGLGFAAGGFMAVLGAAYTSKLTQKYAVGPVMTTGFVLTAMGWTTLSLTPYVTDQGPWRAIAFGFSQIIFQAGVSLFFVTYLAMRQVLTPVELLSRVTATMRFITVAAAPVGALLAGYLGDWMGVRQTLWLIAGCSVVLVLSVSIGTSLSKMQNPIFRESKSV
jgi:Transmembrane secretion effector